MKQLLTHFCTDKVECFSITDDDDLTVLKTFGGTFSSLHYGKIGRIIRVIDLLADVGYLDRVIISADCPRLVLKAVDTVGIAYLIVDIEHEYRAVDIDVYMIDAVGRLREEIAVYIG